ncbi:RHS repeat domain-containing protein [Streptomyces sp. NPDC051098]|uniref:RHS repeat domain-containing protein n=1 Tax=Streptomyces sp. NPDC051098 TaxID=3155411 RepID=UPI003415350A
MPPTPRIRVHDPGPRVANPFRENIYTGRPAGGTTRWTYDTRGRLVSATGALGAVTAGAVRLGEGQMREAIPE